MNTLKKILITVAAIVAGGLFVAIFEGIGHLMYPPPEVMKLDTPEGIAKAEDLLAKAPIWALLWVGFAFFVGSFVSGYVCARFSHKEGIFITGALMLFFGFQNFITVTHPTWFVMTAPAMQIAGSALALFLYPKIATMP